MKKNFAVQSQSFETYEKFKKAVEEIGYEYNSAFCEFKEHKLENNDCLFFSKSWDKINDFKFSFLNKGDESLVFNIDYEIAYEKAIAYAKELIQNRSAISVSIYDIAKWQNCEVSDLQITF